MKEILSSILSGQTLDESEASFALAKILSGAVPLAQAAAFLTTIQMRGMTLSELRGFHGFLRQEGQRLDFSNFVTIDVCGTGGDGKNTFNISTLAAFVMAGAGFKVAKHGNASATSGCGSSDVLQALEIEFTNDENVLRQQLETANICYLHAPLFQPILKAVAPLRREIGFRTFFNLLGPLLNPAEPQCQLIGVFEPAVLRLYRYFLEDSGVQFALVYARDGYDEISLTGAFDVISDSGAETFYPEDLGFNTFTQNDLRGGKTAEECAEQFLLILNGAGSEAQMEVVTANAAFAMRMVKPEFSLTEGREQAAESLLSGKALNAFNILKKF